MRVLLAACALAAMTVPAVAQETSPDAGTNVKIRQGWKNAKVGFFDYDGDKDAVYFYGQKGQNLGVWAHSYCDHGSTVELRDHNWKLLATDTQMGSPAAESFAEARAPYTGKYFMTITDRPVPPGPNCTPADSNAAYIYAAMPNCAHDKATGCKLPLGDNEIRHIWGPSDQAWARLTVPKAATYTIIGSDVDGIQSWRDGGAIMSLRKASTAVITATGRQDAYQCDDAPVGCLKAKLAAGVYFVTMRMPQTPINEGYRISVRAD